MGGKAVPSLCITMFFYRYPVRALANMNIWDDITFCHYIPYSFQMYISWVFCITYIFPLLACMPLKNKSLPNITNKLQFLLYPSWKVIFLIFLAVNTYFHTVHHCNIHHRIFADILKIIEEFLRIVCGDLQVSRRYKLIP